MQTQNRKAQTGNKSLFSNGADVNGKMKMY